MSKKEKLIKRLLTIPSDFTYAEMVTLLAYFEYIENQGNGSAVKFIKEGSPNVINFHRPHPNGILKKYVLRQVIEKLEKEDLI